MRLEATGLRMQAWLSTIQSAPGALSVQLDVELELWKGQVLIESCGGFGATEAEAHQHAFENFAASSLHVLLSAFLRPSDRTGITVAEWEISGTRREVLTGPLVFRGMQPDMTATQEWTYAVEDTIQALPLVSGTHWVRIFYAHQPGHPDTLEVLLDNQPWGELHEALAHAPWPRLPEFFSQRLFLVIRGGLDVSRAVPLLIEHSSRETQQVIQMFREQGATPLEAEKLYVYLPYAFARALLEDSGLRFPDTLCFSSASAGVERWVSLSTEPLWRESLSLARRAIADSRLSREDVVSIARLYGLTGPLIAALNKGEAPEGIRISSLLVTLSSDAAAELSTQAVMHPPPTAETSSLPRSEGPPLLPGESPWSHAFVSLLFLALGAGLAWLSFSGSARLDRTAEARLTGCQLTDPSGNRRWTLDFDPEPRGVFITSGSDEFDATINKLCARQARVRVVSRLVQGNAGGARALRGLDSLDDGVTVVPVSNAAGATWGTFLFLGGAALVSLFIGGAAGVRAFQAYRSSSPAEPPAPVLPLVKTGGWMRPPRRTDLGPSFGVDGLPLGVRLFPLLWALLCLYGGSRYLGDYWGTSSQRLGFWTYSFPLGLVLVLVGVGLVGACWWLFNSGVEVFLEGVVQSFPGREHVLRFSDLRTFSYRPPHERGIPVGQMTFISKNGAGLSVKLPPGGNSTRFAELRDLLARQLAEQMEAKLNPRVPWLDEIELHRQGLVFPLHGTGEVLRYSDFTYAIDNGFLSLKRGNTELGQCWTSNFNFYPGLVLLERMWKSARGQI